MFWVGQKVECVSIRFSLYARILAFIRPPLGGMCKIGEVYTIANIYRADYTEMLEFVDLPAPGGNGWFPGFIARHFRPIQERKTEAGMAILQSLLTPAPQKTRETV